LPDQRFSADTNWAKVDSYILRSSGDGASMRVWFDGHSLDSYRLFLKVKALPAVQFVGDEAIFPDEYAAHLGLQLPTPAQVTYQPSPFLFDYQRDITALAIRKRKFDLFMECGYGKTICYFEYIKHVRQILPAQKRILLVSPLMVVRQTIQECQRFYGDTLPIAQVKARNLRNWLLGQHGDPAVVGITNYEAITEELEPGLLGCLVLDESSYLKSHYGKWGTELIRLGRGLEWKLTGTGTPAPNDRIEYANHAVFLDAFPTVNAFLAKYFVNRGQTDNRWELKPHALGSFYRDLSHWCIFLTNPATYGWQDNTSSIPPIHVHIHDVPLTSAQEAATYQQTGELFVGALGGITSRGKLSQIAKGNHNGTKIATNKPQFIRDLVDSWPSESTIIWCRFNAEQDELERWFPGAASIAGDTPYEQREELLAEFQSGQRKVLISKPKVLGFGLNLQIATRQVFSSCEDSYEQFHQCVKRSNRIGSTLPLNVHLPVTELERPQMENVLRKANRVQQDTEEQERLFKGFQHAGQW